MWMLFSIGAAFFAGITPIFTKIGLKDTNVSVATALRVVAIFIFTSLVVFFTNNFKYIYSLDIKTIICLVLSSVLTLLLWIVYFKALSLGDISKVSPVDKTSIILTLILSFIFVNEKITFNKVLSIIFIFIGTILMTNKKSKKSKENNKWIIFAILTAIFSSLASIVAKIFLSEINSTFASFFRTFTILIILWVYMFLSKKYKLVKGITKKSYLYIILSGVSTGISWLCYYNALNNGEVSIVFCIEKLSILFSVILSVIFLKEKINLKGWIGFISIIIGVIVLVI